MVQAFNRRFTANFTLQDIRKRNPRRRPRPRNADGARRAGPIMPPRRSLFQKARGFLRQELTDLEQFVLIQIFDQTWKDHLYAMDMLKGSVGLAGFAEQDPRIVYKKEGYRVFQADDAGRPRQGHRPDLPRPDRRRQPGPQRISRNGCRPRRGRRLRRRRKSRRHRRRRKGRRNPRGTAPKRRAKSVKAKTIVRDIPKVGRNDPCPCGSGKKYKKCCGANVA